MDELSPAQQQVLHELADHGTLIVSDSAMSGGSLADNAVRTLVRKGFVRYRTTVDDGEAELTDAGRDVLDTLA